MTNLKNGFLAGFIATAVLSVLMVAKAMMGVMPELDVAAMLAVMMGAPNLIRGGSHSGNVAAEELAKADLLDIVSSDYVPSALLLSAFRLADIWNDLPRAVATVTSNPAKAVRLHDRGTLRSGLRGDVLRVRKIDQTPLLRGVWSQGNKVG